MIFAHTFDAVMSGKKTQTRRRADDLFSVTNSMGEIIAIRRMDKCATLHWRIGGRYSVQRGRANRASARIEILEIRFVADPLVISPEDAAAEGFRSIEEFQDAWRKIHGRNAGKAAYALTFRLISENK